MNDKKADEKIKVKKKNRYEEEEDFLDFTESPNENKRKNRRTQYLKADPYYDSNFFSRLFYVFGYFIIKYIRDDIPSPSNIGSLKKDNKSINYRKN